MVPLLFAEPHTSFARALLERDEHVVVWWSTYVECCSAISRSRRVGKQSEEAQSRAVASLDLLRQAWYEITPAEEIRKHARRLLEVHPLRAADALQLAAAIQWSGHRAGGELVSFDTRLAEAARREGFKVIPMDGATGSSL